MAKAQIIVMVCFDKIFKKATSDYINKIYKILFYIELLNKNDISKETLTNIKNRINTNSNPNVCIYNL